MLGVPESIRPYFVMDHDRLDAAFAKFRRMKHSHFAAARESFREFKVGLERHIAWEEQILFPLFERKTGLTGHGPTAVLRLEHQRIGECLEALHRKVQNRDADSDAEEQALLQALAAHNEKEERILYPALDHLTSQDEKMEVFTAMQAMPEEAFGRCCAHMH
jgi:iron-sulfur cluster repair protein YtfE (RIC family)